MFDFSIEYQLYREIELRMNKIGPCRRSFMSDFPTEYPYIIDHQKIAQGHLQSHSSHTLDEDWMMYDYFGCLYVINLPRAKDRLETITKDLQDIGVDQFDIMPAVDGRKNVPKELWKKMTQNWANYNLAHRRGRKKFKRQQQGETGCYLSHLKVIKLVKRRFDQANKKLQKAIINGNKKEYQRAVAQARKYSSVMILEDDNAFGIVEQNKKAATLNNVGVLFRKAMAELPKDWDMCYFMAWSRKPEQRISSHIVQLSEALFNNAYAVNHTFYSAVIAHLERIYDPDVTQVLPLDAALGELHSTCRSYAVTPAISYQREGVSNITSFEWERFRQIQPIYNNGIQNEG